MATYAIGDVQGCGATLKRLVKQIAFDPKKDRLRFVGDLVNRGPDNLSVLRFIADLGDRADTVLGNHDLHLIARSMNLRPEKKLDTLDDVLGAPDCKQLVEWLAARPLLIHDGDRVYVHAGLLPSWTVAAATKEARRLEQALHDPKQRPKLLDKEHYDPSLKVLSTIRTIHDDGTLCKFAGGPEVAPKGCRPWFSHPDRQSMDVTVVFGHWSALGYKRGPGFLALDSGCVWGQALTAVRLDDGKVYSERCADRVPEERP